MGRSPWSRRDFIAATALTAGGCAALGATRDIIDAHVHFYDPGRPQGVPWPPPGDSILYRAVLPEELEALARPLGVSGIVAVEASEWVDDNFWLLDLADRHPFILGVVGNLPVGQPAFGPAFQRCRVRNRFKGVRIRGPVLREALEGGLAADHLALLAQGGLAVDLLIRPEELPDAARLAGRFPSLRVIVDHCANVALGPERPPNAWVSGLAACHYAPNVFMKISGLVEGSGRGNGDAPTDPAYYRERFDPLYRVFGPDRLLFATNWPVCLHFAAYPATLALARALLASAPGGGPTAAGRALSRSAARAYRL